MRDDLLPAVEVEVTESLLSQYDCTGSQCVDVAQNAVAVACLEALRADERWNARLPEDATIEVLAGEDYHDGWTISLIAKMPPPWDEWVRLSWQEEVEVEPFDEAASITAVMLGERAKPFKFKLCL